jgi:poly(3-hydroxybutyrate) depolymerase
MPLTRVLAASTHGRYLVQPPAVPGPAPLLVGFHGYAEDAEAQLARLQDVEGADAWLLVSVQGLHRFYRGRTRDVVASWMTRQDRELAIADNVAFVSSVVATVAREWPVADALVFAGFSQGVATAFRAACGSPRPVSGVLAVGGDIPPELDRAALARLPAVLLGRGARDEWYNGGKWSADQARLRDAQVDLRPLLLEAGHEWTRPFGEAAGRLLRDVTRPAAGLR